MNKLDLSILVPVYNEEKTLSTILKKIEKAGFSNTEIIVVDDCSRDKSPEIIKKWASKKHTGLSVQTITHEVNRGKGAGIKSALKVAKGKYFVIQDADLEYEPIEIKALISYALEKDAPVVYGSRFMGSIKGMPKPNYYANRFYNILVRILYGVKITDMHTCYKMIRTDIFRSLNVQAEGFGYAPEVISKLLRDQTPIVELPISFNGRTVSEGKKINVADGIECLSNLIRFRFMDKEKLHTLDGGKRGFIHNLANGQLWRFLLVGVTAFAVNAVFLHIFFSVFTLPLLTAQIIAAEGTIIYSFLLHHNWTYKHYKKKNVFFRFAEFNIAALGGAAISTLSVLFFTKTIGLHYIISLAIGALLATFWNYFANYYIVWSNNRSVSIDTFNTVFLEQEFIRFSYYLLKEQASVTDTQMYVNALKDKPVDLTTKDLRIICFASRHPWSIGLFDCASAIFRPKSELRRRLFIGFAILEVNPKYVVHFLPKKMGVLHVARIALVGAKSVIKSCAGFLLLVIV